jgi:hypothetical protein
VEGFTLSTAEDFFNLPWPGVAGFATLLSLLLFTFGPKFGVVSRFFGQSIQELLGVTALRETMLNMHAENKAEQDKFLARLEAVEKLVKKGSLIP